MSYQDTALFGYVPSEAAAIFGTAYFGIACLVILIQIALGPYKHGWLLTLALAALGETIGWSSRLWAHYAVSLRMDEGCTELTKNKPLNWIAYTIQLCTLVVTPVFLSAADYVLFSRIIAKSHTRLFALPKQCYWIFFVLGDIVSLAIQTVGAVEVSNLGSLESGDSQTLDHGNSVLRSGIAFQLSNTVSFTLLICASVPWQRYRGQTTIVELAGRQIMVSMSLSTVMLLVRNAYRIFELQDGYNSTIMRTERYLIGWDMIPMALAIGILIIFSPCFFLKSKKRERGILF